MPNMRQVMMVLPVVRAWLSHGTQVFNLTKGTRQILLFVRVYATFQAGEGPPSDHIFNSYESDYEPETHLYRRLSIYLLNAHQQAGDTCRGRSWSCRSAELPPYATTCFPSRCSSLSQSLSLRRLLSDRVLLLSSASLF